MVGAHAEIRPIAGSDDAGAGKAKMRGGCGRGQSQCAYRVHAEFHGAIDDDVHVALSKKVVGMAVVAHEHAPGPGMFVDRRKKRCEILRLATLPYHDGHSLGDLLPGLLQRSALVVGRNARGDVGVETEAAQARSMAVDAIFLKEKEFVGHIGKCLEYAGGSSSFQRAPEFLDGEAMKRGRQHGVAPRTSPGESRERNSAG